VFSSSSANQRERFLGGECYDGRRLSMKKITILGSTGSIGTSTLDVIRRNPDRYAVHALAAGRNIDRLVEQIAEFHPQIVVTADEAGRERLRNCLREKGFASSDWPELHCGATARLAIATAPET